MWSQVGIDTRGVWQCGFLASSNRRRHPVAVGIGQAMNLTLKSVKARVRKDELPVRRLSRPDKQSSWFANVMLLVTSHAFSSQVKRETAWSPGLLPDEASLRGTEERKRGEPFALLSHLGACIAHEVSQPISAIVMNGEACLRWLNREAPQIDKATACVQSMIDDGRRAREIIKCIRTLATASAPQEARLQLNDVINDAIPLVRHDLLSHGVSLQLRLAPDLPPLLGDRVQLQQVFINLILNGIQAMSDISDRPRELHIESHRDASGCMTFAVRDSGTGIAPEHACRLFNAFFTTKLSGMGIGLAMCRSIIEAHRGTIQASNNAGHGATFECRLPAFEAGAEGK